MKTNNLIRMIKIDTMHTNYDELYGYVGRYAANKGIDLDYQKINTTIEALINYYETKGEYVFTESTLDALHQRCGEINT